MIPESSESLWALSLFSVVEMDNMKEPLLKLKAMLYKEKPKQKLEHKNLRRFHVHILHLIMLGGSIIWYLLTASLFSITDSPQPLEGAQLGSGCHIDFQEPPDRVHAVKHAQGESEVHNHKPGGVAIKWPFHSILEEGVSPKRGHDPQLERCERKKQKSEDDKLSSTCTLISALAQVG